MIHQDFQNRYTCRQYHGETITNQWGDAISTVQVTAYEADKRTIMGDGQAMVVWAVGEGSRTPGFLRGYCREDALTMAAPTPQPRKTPWHRQ